MASTLMVDHVGNPVDLICTGCPLILPMLIKIGVFAVAGIVLGGLAVGLALRNERRESHRPMADPFEEVENAESKSEDEQAPT